MLNAYLSKRTSEQLKPLAVNAIKFQQENCVQDVSARVVSVHLIPWFAAT